MLLISSCGSASHEAVGCFSPHDDDGSAVWVRRRGKYVSVQQWLQKGSYGGLCVCVFGKGGRGWGVGGAVLFP